MATGRLGTADLAAATLTTVYTAPPATTTGLTVRMTNRNTLGAFVRLALADTATPTDAEWIEYDTPLPGHGVLESSGIMLAAGQKIVAYSATANVSVVVYGVEE